jgi:glycosyltransferase involved in cell wall biosynthesis
LGCEDRKLFFLMLVPAADHEKVRALMMKHRLPESCVLLTELPHDQVTSALRLAHVGLLLRHAHPVNEVSSPTKFGEYLAAGLPVLMTDGIGDFSRLAAEERVGLVLEASLLQLDKFPKEELSRVIDFVRESRQRRALVADRCRDLARARLHWDASTAALLESYRAIAPTEVALGRQKANDD